LPGGFDAARPPYVVQLTRAIDRDSHVYPILAEQAEVVVVDEDAVGLYAVRAEPFQPPPPKFFEVLLRNQERLASEKGERTAIAFHGGLHGCHVIALREIAGVPLRVLVAILANNIAAYSQRA
jgi:hypothetical protein